MPTMCQILMRAKNTVAEDIDKSSAFLHDKLLKYMCDEHSQKIILGSKRAEIALILPGQETRKVFLRKSILC